MSTNRKSGPTRFQAPQHWLWSMLAGLAFAVTALLAGSFAQLRISPIALGGKGEITIANMLCGVFICGWLIWWLLVARPRQVTLLRGAVAGVLVACLSYPAVLLLAEFLNSDDGAADKLANLPVRIVQVLFQSAFALVTTGFASTLVLALVGMLIAWLQRRLAAYRPDTATTTHSAAAVFRLLFRAIASGAAFIFVFLVAGFTYLSLLPVPRLSSIIAAEPSDTYAQAIAGFAVIQAHEATLPLRPECRSQLRTHGDKAAQVVIYFHGLTSCPAQGDALAQVLFDNGYNVLVPRLPGHGEDDPLTLALAAVTAEDFVNTANTAIAIAHGLGQEVSIMGLSAGGTISTYETQEDSSITTAISVAPFLGPAFLPPWATQAATNLLLAMPNVMMWWNSKTPYSSPEMPYVYPRFATHVIGELMRLGRITAAEASVQSPSLRQSGVLLNLADQSINNQLAEQLVAEWSEHGASVDLQFLPAADGLPHDVIDPHEPHGNVGIVYPKLLEMISAERR